MANDENRDRDQERGQPTLSHASPIPTPEPQFPIQFLYFDDGFYHYSSHCCMADDHFGYIASKEELPLTDCVNNPTGGVEEQKIDIDDNPAGTIFPKFLPRVFVTAQTDVGRRAAAIDTTKAYQGNGNAIVTPVLRMGNVQFTNHRGSAFDKIKNKSFTLRHVFSPYVAGEQNDRQRFQSFMIADRCRGLEAGSTELKISAILPDNVPHGVIQNIFFVELEEPIGDLQYVLVVAKNP